MNQVLPFPSAAPERRRAPSATACEIVIFPGVRIEYHERRAAEPARRQRAAPMLATEVELVGS